MAADRATTPVTDQPATPEEDRGGSVTEEATRSATSSKRDEATGVLADGVRALLKQPVLHTSSTSFVARSGQLTPPLRSGETGSREGNCVAAHPGLRFATSRSRWPPRAASSAGQEPGDKSGHQARRRCAPRLSPWRQGARRAGDSQAPPTQRKWMPLSPPPKAVSYVDGGGDSDGVSIHFR